MIINNLKINNFKKIGNLEIDTSNKNIVILSGKNEAGKTSVLDAIAAAIGGKKLCPAKPIKDGEKNATIEVEFNAFTVRRHFTQKGSTLEVITKGEHKFGSPQQVLDGFVGKLTWNPSEWINNAKNQKQTLLEAIEFDFDKEKFKQRFDVEVIDDQRNSALDIIDIARNDLYMERRDLNRDLKNKKSAVDEYESGLPDGWETVEKVDVGELIEKENAIVEEKERQKRHVSKVNYLMLDKADVEKKIAALTAEKKRIENEILNHDKIIGEFETIDENKIGEIRHRIGSATKINVLCEKAQMLNAMKKEADDLESKSALLSVRIEKIDDYKQEIVDSANMPVPGLSIENGEVTFRGQPIEQASHARKLEIAIAIGMALNPKIKIIRITDGEKFDSDSMAVLEKMAKENDYQIWLEIMDESGELGFFIREGELIKNDGKEENIESNGNEKASQRGD